MDEVTQRQRSENPRIVILCSIYEENGDWQKHVKSCKSTADFWTFEQA